MGCNTGHAAIRKPVKLCPPPLKNTKILSFMFLSLVFFRPTAPLAVQTNKALTVKNTVSNVLSQLMPASPVTRALNCALILFSFLCKYANSPFLFQRQSKVQLIESPRCPGRHKPFHFHPSWTPACICPCGTQDVVGDMHMPSRSTRITLSFLKGNGHPARGHYTFP